GQLVEEVDDTGRPGAHHLDPAEECSHVDLARTLYWSCERWVRKEHPRLERKVVPHSSEPVLVRVAVSVDHARHDREARAVDHLGGRAGPLRAHALDPALGHSDVCATEVAPTYVYETVPENEVGHLRGRGDVRHPCGRDVLVAHIA